MNSISRMKTYLHMLVLLMTTISAAFGENREPNEQFGLTSDQLLSMGMIKWRDLYMQKVGSDAFHERNAYGIYTKCLYEKVNEHLSKLPNKEQIFFKKVNSHLSKILDCRIDAERSMGGGTVLPLFQASFACEETQLLLELLCGTAKTTKTEEADVWKAVRKVQLEISEALTKSKEASDYFVSFEEAKVAQKKFDSLNSELKSLFSLMEPRPLSERNPIMDYLVKIIILNLGE